MSNNQAYDIAVSIKASGKAADVTNLGTEAGNAFFSAHFGAGAVGCEVPVEGLQALTDAAEAEGCSVRRDDLRTSTDLAAHPLYEMGQDARAMGAEAASAADNPAAVRWIRKNCRGDRGEGKARTALIAYGRGWVDADNAARYSANVAAELCRLNDGVHYAGADLRSLRERAERLANEARSAADAAALAESEMHERIDEYALACGKAEAERESAERKHVEEIGRGLGRMFDSPEWAALVQDAADKMRAIKAEREARESNGQA